MGFTDRARRILQVGGEREQLEDGVRLMADSEHIAVETCKTAEAARAWLSETRADCIVCEDRLPDSSVLDLLETLRDTHPDLPVLVVTGDDETAEDAVAAGATDVFLRSSDSNGSQLLARRLENVLAYNRLPRLMDLGQNGLADDGLETLLLDSLDDVFYVLDTSGDLVRWNDQFTAVTGYSDDELAGMHALDFFHGEDVDQVRDAIETVLDTGAAALEAEFVTKDDERIPFDWTGALLTDSADRARGIVGIGRDSTERTERERQLRRRTRAMDEAPVGITLSDPTKDDNPLIYANNRFLSLTGYSKDEMLGDNCRFLQGEDTDPEAVAEIRRAIAAAEPTSVELRNYRKDGTEFWNQLTVAPVETEDGEVTNYVGFQQDVTERKEREQLLRSRTRAMEEAPVGITIHDGTVPNAPITYANEAFEQLTGYRRSAVEGETITRLAGADTDGDRLGRVEAALDSGEHASEVVPLYRRDGTPFWSRTTLAPVTDEDGETVQFVGFFQDVTETKEHEQQIQRRLNEFGEVLAEDLRLPVRNAKEHLKAAKTDGESADLDELEGAFDRIESLIEDLTTVHSDAVKPRDVFDGHPNAGDER